MTSTSLVTVPIELMPNPLPYGRLSLRKGIWDQMQAQKAYEESESHPPDRQPALDKKI